MLIEKASGDSMEELYPLVPDCLKGFVELVYDSNSNPLMRVLEPLIYREWYDPSLQSLVFSEIVEDFRGRRQVNGLWT
jgi:hypothetical protein